VFGWLRRKPTEEAERPETAVFRFDKVDPVKPSPKFGNTGPQGWGFTLWGSPDGEEFMYRHLLETFATQNPDARLELPKWSDCEDLIEGELIWRSQYVWVWYEKVLSHIWLWSAERDVIDSLRCAMLPMAKPN
jgi:hypothetical protein